MLSRVSPTFVAQGIVDLLKTRPIQIHHRHNALVPARMAMANESLSIRSLLFGQPGQCVMQRQGFQHLVGILEFLYNSRTSSHVMDTRLTSTRFKWFGDEILRAGRECRSL